MNTNSDFDRHAATFLADGPTELSDRVLDAALREVHKTRQRRRWSAPWRASMMSLRLGAAALVAIVAVVGVVAFNLIGSGVGTNPSQSPTTTASPSLAALPTAGSTPTLPPIDTSSWTIYASARNWLAIAHPADWTERPATTDWSPDATTWTSTGVDTFVGPGDQIRISAFSVAVGPGTSLDAWIQAYCAKNSEPCTDIQSRAVQVYAGSGDRHPGLLVPFTQDTAAFFLDVDRVYVVHSWRPAQQFDSRRLLEAFVTTLCFDCASPAGATPRPS